MNQRKAMNRVQERRAKRTRARIRAVSDRPRLAVFRSNQAIYAQLIDDMKGHTLAAASSREVKKEKGVSKTDVARKVGTLLAERAEKAKAMEAVFDRRGYRYHGRVKALVEGARGGGLKV